MRSRLKRWIFESYDSVFITFFRQILTKDSVTVFVNAIMYYKVNVIDKIFLDHPKSVTILNSLMFKTFNTPKQNTS